MKMIYKISGLPHQDYFGNLDMVPPGFSKSVYDLVLKYSKDLIDSW